MKTFYKIIADEQSVLDMFNSMWKTNYKMSDIAFYDDMILLSSGNYYRLYQAVVIFNDNCEYGKVYLEEL